MDHPPPKPSLMPKDQPAETIKSEQFKSDKAPAGVEEAQYGETPNLQVKVAFIIYTEKFMQ
ncbi:hypothetical protein Hanom_Chr13g01219871 [Helianthus anomalus]